MGVKLAGHGDSKVSNCTAAVPALDGRAIRRAQG
jgi:hypothetical protein